MTNMKLNWIINLFFIIHVFKGVISCYNMIPWQYQFGNAPISVFPQDGGER